MKRILLLFLVYALAIPVTAMAETLASPSVSSQNKGGGEEISGVITDKSGSPVVGASVAVPGTSKGTVTDVDGRYSLVIPEGTKELEVSCIGYKAQKITVGKSNKHDVILEEDTEYLDEVVVVGYGTMKKSDLSGASVSMNESDLRGSVITNLDQSLQGRAAGVQAVQTSGAPGSSSSIRVRGQATINASAEPLYVIDGVIVQSIGASSRDYGLGTNLDEGKTSTLSPLATINPADIVSLEILKDASATAIYGAQGANGVVLITTKRGKAGEAKFTYDGMVAVSRQTRRLDVLNLREFAEYYNDMVSIGEMSPSAWYNDPSILGKGTNWQDEVFRTAIQHQHQISAQGGTEKVQYYISGSYMDQEGTVIGSEFNRYSVRTNVDARLKEWFKLGLSAAYTKTNDDIKLADGTGGVIFFSLTTAPEIPVYDVDGNFTSTPREGYTNANSIALAMMDEYLLSRWKLNGNLYAELTPVKHFVFRSELGFDMSGSDANTYQPRVDLGGWSRNTNKINWQKNNNNYWQLKNYLTYSNKFFGRHNITAMVGQECWTSNWNFLGVTNTDLPSDEVHNIKLATGDPVINSAFGSTAMASFFTRETYNLNDRYLFTYTFRYDGSSNFGPDNRWAGFHSFAGSWRFTNERFLQGIKNALKMSYGKIRIGWGQTGNAGWNSGAWESGMIKLPSALGDSQRPSNIPNPGIHWEKQVQTNIGLDLGFFDGAVNLTMDIYKKKSSDMLMSLNLPSYIGTLASWAIAAPRGNYGSIENKGLEITLDTHPINHNGFSWDSNFQISFNRNKLVSLDGTANAQLVGYGQWQDVISVTEIGKSLYNFYGYKVAGVYTSLEDIQNSPKAEKYPVDGVFNRYTTVWVGDLKYEDINNDGVINEKDKTDLGSPLPKFTFGWTNTFRYKNFDLSIFINGSYGNKILNYNLIGQGNGLVHMTSSWQNQLSSIKDRARITMIDPQKTYKTGNWYDDIANLTVANPKTKTPRPSVSDPNDNDRMSDRYIEDGSYIRLKNISLGYTFPKSLLKKLKIDNLRTYINIQNLYTLTKYTGYDPEVGANTRDGSGLTFGVDNGRYPSPMTCTFGLNITF